MFDQLPLFQVASSMARHASARHQVIAENVANADTPGFRARDVKAFSEYVNEPFTPRATRPGHVGGSPILRAANQTEVFLDETVDESGNDNSVSLESEMVKSVQSQGQHALAMAIYRKASDLMRISLGRR
ncbi:MAG: FlgB family protein [Pseudomonadota bacterium]